MRREDTLRARAPIVITAERVGQLRAEYERQTGLTLRPSEEKALVRGFVDDEILYREALARGLDKADQSVRWRLVEKMRFLSEAGGRSSDELYHEAVDLGLDRDDAIVRGLLIQKMRLLLAMRPPGGEPDDAALHRYLAAHRDDYAQPARVSFSHVFLSAQRHGTRLQRDAADLLARLRSGAAPVPAGDPFPLGRHYRSTTRHDLEKVFGADFAARLFALSPGEWLGPIPSALGLHAVRIDAIEPARLPPLDAVRSRVRQRLLTEQREQLVAQRMQRLRGLYRVRFERRQTAAGGALRSEAPRRPG